MLFKEITADGFFLGRLALQCRRYRLMSKRCLLPLKRRPIAPRLQGVAFQKTVIFTPPAVRT
jgi:hypothetical protein